MIREPVGYATPDTVPEAIAVLRDTPGSRPLAGGQTLMAELAAGDRKVSTLVDLRRIAALRGIRVNQFGDIHVGAMSTLDELATDPSVRAMVPALAEAAAAVGDPRLRERATVAGNLASAASGTDLPAAALALDARVLLAGPAGNEALSAEEFLVRGNGSRLITAVVLPARDSRSAFDKLAEDTVPMPVSAVAAELTWSPVGTVHTVRIGLTGPVELPVRLVRVEQALVGTRAGRETVLAAFDALPDELFTRTRGRSVDYLKHASGELAARAVRRTGG
jgi:carbon-monoxide dehydrogenase medium subunit